MIHTPTTICYNENGIIREITGTVHLLCREQSVEVLYTSAGQRIELKDIVRLGTVDWSSN